MRWHMGSSHKNCLLISEDIRILARVYSWANRIFHPIPWFIPDNWDNPIPKRNSWLYISHSIQLLVGGFKHEWIIFHFIYGMSSGTHWLIFFKMVIAPPTRWNTYRNCLVLYPGRHAVGHWSSKLWHRSNSHRWCGGPGWPGACHALLGVRIEIINNHWTSSTIGKNCHQLPIARFKPYT